MIKAGSRVRVVKGRKVPIGTDLTVLWAGDGRYGPSVAFKLDPEEEKLSYLDLTNVVELDAQGRPVVAEGQPARPATPANGQARPEAPITEREVAVLRIRDLEATNVALASEADALRVEVAAHKAEVARLQALVARLNAQVEALSARPSAVAPVLDEGYLSKVAAYAAQQVETAVKIALRTKLHPEADRALAERNAERAARNGEDPRESRGKNLDLETEEHVPKRVANLPQGDVGPARAKELAEEAAKAPQDRPTPLPEAPAPEPRPDAPGGPEAPRKGGLAKCPKCKKFAIGNHECAK